MMEQWKEDINNRAKQELELEIHINNIACAFIEVLEYKINSNFISKEEFKTTLLQIPKTLHLILFKIPQSHPIHQSYKSISVRSSKGWETIGFTSRLNKSSRILFSTHSQIILNTFNRILKDKNYDFTILQNSP